MARVWTRVALVGLLVGGSLACGNDSNAGKQKVYSGNDGTKTSRRLTAEEKEAILSGEAFASTTEIVCPPTVNMREFDPEADYPGKDYGSFLAMRGGSFGYVTRERGDVGSDLEN